MWVRVYLAEVICAKRHSRNFLPLPPPQSSLSCGYLTQKFILLLFFNAFPLPLLSALSTFFIITITARCRREMQLMWSVKGVRGARRWKHNPCRMPGLENLFPRDWRRVSRTQVARRTRIIPFTPSTTPPHPFGFSFLRLPPSTATSRSIERFR